MDYNSFTLDERNDRFICKFLYPYNHEKINELRIILQSVVYFPRGPRELCSRCIQVCIDNDLVKNDEDLISIRDDVPRLNDLVKTSTSTTIILPDRRLLLLLVEASMRWFNEAVKIHRERLEPWTKIVEQEDYNINQYVRNVLFVAGANGLAIRTRQKLLVYGEEPEETFRSKLNAQIEESWRFVLDYIIYTVRGPPLYVEMQ